MPTVRLKCPKCKKQFDYFFIPGVAVNAIRIWNQRYMMCPKCKHFSLFKLAGEGVRVVRR